MRAYERLIQYARVDTASDPAGRGFPSTQRQWELLRLLEQELRLLGAAEVELDGYGYLFARIPANIPDYQGYKLGFLAHVDVTPDAPSANVQPRVEHYDGAPLALGPGRVLSEEQYPQLAACRGCELVITDGRTLLGADDKAGVAEIMTLAELLLSADAPPHGDIMLGFTPDEEIGKGPEHFDVQRFGADLAFTVDGGDWQEYNYETFNAVSAEAEFRGFGIHPGDAKGYMVNASLLAMEFAALLPVAERPEYTQGYEGFFHLHSMSGEVERARLSYILRDHDRAILERRMAQLQAAADFINAKYGEQRVLLSFSESYRNLAEALAPYPFLLELARDAISAVGGSPCAVAARGGTDGSQLSFMGLPCPNLGTGSGNHHSCYEYACVQHMDKVTEILLHLAAGIAVIPRERGE